MSKQHFAIIPAAGLSLRMRGPNKLLLPWRDKRPILAHCLQAWQQSQVTKAVIVVKMEDRDITDLCTQFPKTEVAAVKSVPQDMRASIDFGLSHLECSQTLCPEDRWLVAPADLPTLNADIINSVCTAAESTKLPVVPFYGVKQGHPVSLGIEHIKSFRDIPVDHGLNSILQEGSYEKLDLPSSWRPRDMDTRQEYEARLRGD